MASIDIVAAKKFISDAAKIVLDINDAVGGEDPCLEKSSQHTLGANIAVALQQTPPATVSNTNPQEKSPKRGLSSLGRFIPKFFKKSTRSSTNSTKKSNNKQQNTTTPSTGSNTNSQKKPPTNGGLRGASENRTNFSINRTNSSINSITPLQQSTTPINQSTFAKELANIEAENGTSVTNQVVIPSNSTPQQSNSDTTQQIPNTSTAANGSSIAQPPAAAQPLSPQNISRLDTEWKTFNTSDQIEDFLRDNPSLPPAIKAQVDAQLADMKIVEEFKKVVASNPKGTPEQESWRTMNSSSEIVTLLDKFPLSFPSKQQAIYQEQAISRYERRKPIESDAKVIQMRREGVDTSKDIQKKLYMEKNDAQKRINERKGGSVFKQGMRSNIGDIMRVPTKRQQGGSHSTKKQIGRKYHRRTLRQA